MAGIFTRPKVQEILADENLSLDDRLDRIMALRGRDLDDGYISKSSAKADRDSAIEKAKEDWEKNLQKPDPKESEEYKALSSEYATYKEMQTARTSDEFSTVKPKFFETVYGMINREEGSKPVKDQLEEIRGNYEEYFTAAQPQKNDPQKNTPQYSQNQGRSGTNPTSEEDKLFEKLSAAWK